MTYDLPHKREIGDIMFVVAELPGTNDSQTIDRSMLVVMLAGDVDHKDALIVNHCVHCPVLTKVFWSHGRIKSYSVAGLIQTHRIRLGHNR